jgi:hypothetical protein
MCMMWDEKQLGEALRKEIEGPAPTVRTQLSDIMPRGLRRRRMRQASSVAAAVAVVVGLGVVASTLDGKPSSSNEPAVPTVTNSETNSVRAEAGWQRANLPPRSPYRTWEPAMTAPPPPGFPKLAIPLCSGDVPDTAGLGINPVPENVRLRLQRGLKAVAPSSKIGEVVDRAGDRFHDLEADVGDAHGMGSVRLTTGTFSGQPLDAADRQAFEQRNCQPPKREVRPDGTVLQLFSVVPSEPFQSLTQVLMIYWPDGKRVAVTVQNWSSADVTLDKRTRSYNRTGAGRPTLPLSELQLAQLAERLTTG